MFNCTSSGTCNFLTIINDLADDAICNIAIYTVGTTIYCKSYQVSDQWQQQGFVLNLDLTYTMDCCKKWLVHFKAGTCQIVLIDWPNGFVTIHVKIDGFVSDEKLDY